MIADDVEDNVNVGGSEGSLVLPMFIIPAAPSPSSHLWIWLVSERRTHQLAATFPTSKHPASSMSMPDCFVLQFVNRTPDFCDFICIFGAESAVSNIRTETGRLVSAQPHYYRHPGTTINRPCNISISNHPHHLATNRHSFFLFYQRHIALHWSWYTYSPCPRLQMWNIMEVCAILLSSMKVSNRTQASKRHISALDHQQSNHNQHGD